MRKRRRGALPASCIPTPRFVGDTYFVVVTFICGSEVTAVNCPEAIYWTEGEGELIIRHRNDQLALSSAKNTEPVDESLQPTLVGYCGPHRVHGSRMAGEFSNDTPVICEVVHINGAVYGPRA